MFEAIMIVLILYAVMVWSDISHKGEPSEDSPPPKEDENE